MSTQPMKLDPQVVGEWVRVHFATITDEEFIANVRRYNPDLVCELGLQDTSPVGAERRNGHD